MAHAGWCPVRCYIAHAIHRQHLVHHLNTTPHGPINGQQVLVDCFDVPARHVIVGTQLSSRPLSDACLCACAVRTASATDIADQGLQKRGHMFDTMFNLAVVDRKGYVVMVCSSSSVHTDFIAKLLDPVYALRYRRVSARTNADRVHTRAACSTRSKFPPVQAAGRLSFLLCRMHMAVHVTINQGIITYEVAHPQSIIEASSLCVAPESCARFCANPSCVHRRTDSTPRSRLPSAQKPACVGAQLCLLPAPSWLLLHIHPFSAGHHRGIISLKAPGR
jgi:hypothetical protein